MRRIELPYTYKTGLPFHVRAMVKAGPRLYLGGIESIEQILGATPGGVLQTFAAADGQREGSPISLPTATVFDGMAVGNQVFFGAMEIS